MLGDVFALDCARNVLYDRIYVGAEAPVRYLSVWQRLLAPGGILLGPFEGQLIQSRRALAPAPAGGAPSGAAAGPPCETRVLTQVPSRAVFPRRCLLYTSPSPRDRG